MNWFYFDTTRPVQFASRINEDVTAYTSGGRRGELFLTSMLVSLKQAQTQKQPGGLTTAYLELGTYVKSFYSVMYCPSAVTVGKMGDHRLPHYRLHHFIDWRFCAPKIVPESVRKPG